ncbi:tRNA (guanine(10)-N2)-methyltransferase [Wickerhamiella sorbophila]|uniref:tRNA (guanine(10)-N(2))-methyltransferase n=1 Tax=Wickerhamiella sorbophila TaxID=45607 RepID=A0A2T0FC52_9ASCO|nr:tRNA (guanine(10)-N2)-methyltransferase [Wickerhamiella sorbophila]PRT52519.1 tRNA (guanine(10)-N2)-methyltransferase [Wickerhamiella sorbophila]
MKFLILFAQAHEKFRIHELEALAEVEGLDVDLSGYSDDYPYLEVELASEHDAKRLVSRSFLIRSVYRVFGQGWSYDDVHAQTKGENFEFMGEKSFRFDFMCFQGSRTKDQQVDIINGFRYLNLAGPVRMKKPDVAFTLIEQFGLLEKEPKYIWFTSFVSDSDRHQIDVYNLKKRPFIGTTSFDAEMAFVTCNMAKIQKNDVVYDPFSGTGSFPVAAAYLEAIVFGSDIDIRSLKGYDKNFKFYNREKNLWGVSVMDFTHNALRKDLVFDAIVCDPPYGVREIIKVCGSKNPEKFAGKENVLIDNVPAHLRPEYIHPKRPYSLDLLLSDLLEFAAARLKVKGRLSFWMPLASDDPLSAPTHAKLRIVSSIPQAFNKWQRWLITYEKRPEGELGETKSVESKQAFRAKYFSGFKE